MLKINKILSKKIKSPLSLQGLFPFCHSVIPAKAGIHHPMSLRGSEATEAISITVASP